MQTIFTIGHSRHTPEHFAGLLEAHGVQVVADVRRHPGSRRVPWTNSGQIERSLPVDYVHLPELGGRRGDDAFRAYAKHMESDEFAAGLERLLAIERRPAMMCAEGDWRKCHRRLVADALASRGVEVLHIDPVGDVEPHPSGEGRLF